MVEEKQTGTEDEMTRRSDTSVAISGKRRERINNAIVKLVNERMMPVKTSEIIHYLIDEYLEEAVRDMIAMERAEKKKG